MRENLDLFVREDVLSIKDLNDDLDISDTQWDFIFDFLLKDTPVVYFEGFRLWSDDIDFFKNVDFLSEKNLLNKHSRNVILFKLKPSFILLNRHLLSKMWEYYEYPKLIFLKDENQEKRLIELSNQLPLIRDKITTSLKSVLMTYRSSEPDVLWVEKSSDMTFPWKTERSPLALEKEANRSWFERFMNSIGFYWSVKIRRKQE